MFMPFRAVCSNSQRRRPVVRRPAPVLQALHHRSHRRLGRGSVVAGAANGSDAFRDQQETYLPTEVHYIYI